MIPARAWSVALQGLSGRMIEVEAAIVPGLPRTAIIGLPDTSISEAKERCKAAVAAARMSWPATALTINLSPATLPKRGSHYDLAIVAAVWAADGKVPFSALESTVLLGELGLDSRVKPVRGLLPALMVARDSGVSRAIVPMSQLGQALLVPGISCWGIETLHDLATFLQGGVVAQHCLEKDSSTVATTSAPDFGDVVGQPAARWALEVAAAGRHHLLLTGVPGVGKTMLAERLPSILPPLTADEALEVAAISSLGIDGDIALARTVPFEAPHHSSPPAAILGGGSRLAAPGAVSRAHRGVLFLDEAPEFNPRVLEGLRTPLEKGVIKLGRSGGDAEYPAAFQLVLAANPCPCGRAGIRGQECQCSPLAVRRYQSRLSGPIRDRLDIQQELLPLRQSLVGTGSQDMESSDTVRQRVEEARHRQGHRLASTPWLVNAQVPGQFMRKELPLPHKVEFLDDQVMRGRISARGMDRILRIAWSVADLSGNSRPTADDLDAALCLRGLRMGAAA
ncbi:MAG: YifB family Mg chelatase-like AAA ATPase [Propionibacteriaceae bacterium]